MSRDKILKAIQENKPKHSITIPEYIHNKSSKDLAKAFIEKTKRIGGICFELRDWTAITNWISEKAKEDTKIASPIEELQSICTISIDEIADPNELESVDLAIIKAQIGVAENGAVWLSEKEMKIRALPFITQHLVLIVDQKKIVCNMHEAYRLIKIDETGFGVFIAGPSKTADIEQSLVIGAQGARSCTVILMEN